MRVHQEALLSVFESWVNRLKWMTKHEGKQYTKSRKIRDIYLRLTETRRAGTARLLHFMECKFRRDRVKYISKRVLNVQAHRPFEEGLFNLEFIPLDQI
jgi:hypothetical protein